MPEQDDQSVTDDYIRESLARWLALQPILDELYREREAQIAQWGVQAVPTGFGGAYYKTLADLYRTACNEAAERGELTMAHILLEETFEALAESDHQKARDELIQVGAVVIQAIQRIDTLLSEAANEVTDAAK